MVVSMAMLVMLMNVSAVSYSDEETSSQAQQEQPKPGKASFPVHVVLVGAATATPKIESRGQSADRQDEVTSHRMPHLMYQFRCRSWWGPTQ